MAEFDLGTALGRIFVDASGAVGGFAAAGGAQAKFEAQVYRSSAALNKVGNTFLVAGGLLAAGIGYAIKSAADFEKELDYFGAVSQATQKEMDLIRTKALQLGRDSAFGASEVAKAFAELGKAGVPARDIINGVGDAIVSLAAAADISMNQAATVVVNTLNTFHLKAEDAVHVVDLLAGGANASTVEIEDLATSIKYAGSVAAALKIPVEDVIAVLSELGNAGIRGSTGGTVLRRILLNLTPVSDKARTAMKELGIITKDGANQFYDAAGNAKSMSEIIGVLHNVTAGLTAQEKVRYLNTLFGNRAVAGAIILADNGTQAFANMKAEMGKVTAEEVMKQRLDNLSGALKILKSSIDTAFIQAGTPMQDMLKGWVKWLTKLVNAFSSLSPHTQKMIMQTVAITAALLIANGIFFKLAASVLRLGLTLAQAARGLKLLWNIAGQVLPLLGKALWALATNPVFLVIAALVALGVALYVLYRKSETFRNAVDALWQWMQKAWDGILGFFKGLPKFFTTAFNEIKGVISGFINWCRTNWDILAAIFLGPIGLVILIFRRFGDEIFGAVKTAIGGIINFFQSLPGTLAGWASTAVNAVIDFFQQLPYRLGFIIGYMIGSWVKFWVDLGELIAEWGPKIFFGIVDWFEQLPGRVIGFLNAVWDGFYAWATRTIEWARKTGSDVLGNIVNFFMQLPGEIIRTLDAAWDGFYRWAQRMINSARDTATTLFNSLVIFFRDLPGNVIGFLNKVWDGFYKWGVDTYNTVSDFTSRVWNNIVNTVEGLPGVVGDALNAVIDAFRSLITRGFNIARDFAGGLWNGFKKGLGINSPSYIEKAMWQMNDNVDGSLKTLRGQVLKVQGVYQSMNKLGTISGPTFNGSTQTSTQAAGTSATGSMYAGDHIQVYAETNADSMDIARDISWEKRIRANA